MHKRRETDEKAPLEKRPAVNYTDIQESGLSAAFNGANMSVTHVFFDLDGTLTDPKEGITNSVAYALSHFGIEVEDKSELIPFIGPPLWDSFEKFYGFSRRDSSRAVTYFREYFADRGIFENYLFDGAREILERLKESGKSISLATSKPTEFAVRILKRFEIDGFFHVTAGSEMNGERVRKDEVIKYALEQNGFPPPERVIMIGDREHDIIGARSCSVRSMGVLYGYGGREELIAAGADIICEKISDIPMLIK